MNVADCRCACFELSRCLSCSIALLPLAVLTRPTHETAAGARPRTSFSLLLPSFCLQFRLWVSVEADADTGLSFECRSLLQDTSSTHKLFEPTALNRSYEREHCIGQACGAEAPSGDLDEAGLTPLACDRFTRGKYEVPILRSSEDAVRRMPRMPHSCMPRPSFEPRTFHRSRSQPWLPSCRCVVLGELV